MHHRPIRKQSRPGAKIWHISVLATIHSEHQKHLSAVPVAFPLHYNFARISEDAVFMTEKISYWIACAASLLVAVLGHMLPARQMPLDYRAMITMSIPLAVVWAVLFAFFVWRFRMRGIWLVVGAPLALWWPLWMVFNDFPPCYYSHNCI